PRSVSFPATAPAPDGAGAAGARPARPIRQTPRVGRARQRVRAAGRPSPAADLLAGDRGALRAVSRSPARGPPHARRDGPRSSRRRVRALADAAADGTQHARARAGSADQRSRPPLRETPGLFPPLERWLASGGRPRTQPAIHHVSQLGVLLGYRGL